MAKRILTVIVAVLAALIVAVGAYVAYVVLTYDRLEDNLPLTPEAPLNEAASAPEALAPGDELSVVTANVGFGAYNADFDFFMDGGTGSVAESADVVREDIMGTAEALRGLNPDFILFQEVDTDGTRSHHVNEYDLLRTQFPDDWSLFCQNYDSAFLAWPLYAPHGANKAGLATFSRLPLGDSLRRSLPISEGFGKFLDLDRCYAITRVQVGDAQLALFNVHLSAYGADADIMAAQRETLYRDMEAERAAGNYVIAGGDFNHDMIGVSGDVYGNATEAVESWAKPYDFEGVPEGFTVGAKAKLDAVGMEGFADAATCRDAGRPYDGTNDRWIMDTFIYSDNIECLDCSTVDLDFAYSDHNPVMLTFRLK
ncbi:endonuclease/exonuclease/phosphatase family protein [uncultured Adlercreutzia sp.]|uniref:endonuclease/exonuclease/phosphatase family protein n=1 Tax=uncultured Adlercreutzia sp. TaxID=875803 RepID=UPI0025D2FA48|nr:endonuclease/exonuclease/phosphatase family protein [uncultured Adlercreutzia sp.]